MCICDDVVYCYSCIQSLERDLQSRVQEVTELQQQLQSSEREKQIIKQQLTRKEAELVRSVETIRREQQQTHEQVRIGVCMC